MFNSLSELRSVFCASCGIWAILYTRAFYPLKFKYCKNILEGVKLAHFRGPVGAIIRVFNEIRKVWIYAFSRQAAE